MAVANIDPTLLIPNMIQYILTRDHQVKHHNIFHINPENVRSQMAVIQVFQKICYVYFVNVHIYKL